MGSVKKWVNPVSAVKNVVSTVKGSSSSGSSSSASSGISTTVTTPADAVSQANQAQYMAKQRGDNQADVSGTLATGADSQASVPTMLSGLGGVTTDEKKLSRRKALGV